jgi:hypothetical protein
MRIVTVHARNLPARLPPALAVAQGGDLVGNQQIVGQRILYGAEPGMALGARAHLLGKRQFSGI